MCGYRNELREQTMTLNIKFHREIKRADGSINHFIGVPAYVTKITGDPSDSFDTVGEARAYSSRFSKSTHPTDVTLEAPGV